MKHLLLVLFAALVLLVGPPGAMAQVTPSPELNASDEPGSFLVFHKFVRGVTLGFPLTEFEVSAVCPTGDLCREGDSVKLVGRWVCPGAKNFPCRETNFNLFTTVNGTVYFNPENVSGFSNTTVPRPPCSEGYLVVYAVDSADRPIKFDGLVGNAVIRWNQRSAGGYNAVPIQAVCNPDPTTGFCTFPTGTLMGLQSAPLSRARGLIFDGVFDNFGAVQSSPGPHYRAVTGEIMGTVKYDAPALISGQPDTPSRTSLTLLTLDVRSNRANFPTNVDFNFYTPFEEVTSTSKFFYCWDQETLTDIDLNLTRDFKGRKGFFKSGAAFKTPEHSIDDDAGPVTLLAIIDTIECTAPGTCSTASVDRVRIIEQYTYSVYNDSIPVPTVFNPH